MSRKSTAATQNEPRKQPIRLTHEQAVKFREICWELLLLQAKKVGLSKKQVEAYLEPDNSLKELSLQRIFLGLISSAANAQRINNAVSFRKTGGREKIGC